MRLANSGLLGITLAAVLWGTIGVAGGLLLLGSVVFLYLSQARLMPAGGPTTEAS